MNFKRFFAVLLLLSVLSGLLLPLTSRAATTSIQVGTLKNTEYFKQYDKTGFWFWTDYTYRPGDDGGIAYVYRTTDTEDILYYVNNTGSLDGTGLKEDTNLDDDTVITTYGSMAFGTSVGSAPSGYEGAEQYNPNTAQKAFMLVILEDFLKQRIPEINIDKPYSLGNIYYDTNNNQRQIRIPNADTKGDGDTIESKLLAINSGNLMSDESGRPEAWDIGVSLQDALTSDNYSRIIDVLKDDSGYFTTEQDKKTALALLSSGMLVMDNIHYSSNLFAYAVSSYLNEHGGEPLNEYGCSSLYGEALPLALKQMKSMIKKCESEEASANRQNSVTASIILNNLRQPAESEEKAPWEILRAMAHSNGDIKTGNFEYLATYLLGVGAHESYVSQINNATSLTINSGSCAPIQIYQSFAYTWKHPDWNPITAYSDITPTINNFDASIHPDLQNALLTLQQMMADDASAQQYQGTVKEQMDMWLLRVKVAMGNTIGIISNDDLESTLILKEIGATGILAPQRFNGHGAVNPLGYYYMWHLYQELIPIIDSIANGVGPFITKEGKDFTTIIDQIEMLKGLYDAFSFIDDPSLWEVWEDKRWDTISEDGKELCLRDMYEWLNYNNAFSIVDDYKANQAGNPFTHFWNYYKLDSSGNVTDSSEGQLSANIRTGIAASAQFLPMKTNVYDPYTWTDTVETEWLLDFYAKFGYNRKVLYMDTNPDAAVNFVNTGGRGALKVATLDDLLVDRDIVLYIDDNLYNVDTLADLVEKSWDRLDNTDNGDKNLGLFDSFIQAITGLWEVSMEEIAKTAEKSSYSTRVRISNDNRWDNFFFRYTVTEDEEADVGEDDIMHYLAPDDLWDEDTGTVLSTAGQVTYSPLMGFATISGIYRTPALRDGLNRILNNNNPVFLSSDTAPYMNPDFEKYIYSYMLLRNLEAQMTVDYATSLDRTSPLYMDIFGNILTESGLVVVPAAANPALFADNYRPVNAALLSTYGDSFHLPFDAGKNINHMLGGDIEGKGDTSNSYFHKDEKSGKWLLNSMRTTSGTMDISRLSTASKDALKELASVFEYDLTVGNYELPIWEQVITEVLRGAPIEHINKQFEGIQVDTRITRNGLILAEKLEFLVDALSGSGQNASLTIPNPAYIDGIEIVVFFIYKVLLLGVLIVWMLNIYLDATGGGINWMTAGKCLGTVALVLALIVGVPQLFELSYYESNKYLLQQETEYLMMLNLEKQSNGEEIGVSKVTEPTTNTKLYLKLAEVVMPWWDILQEVGLGATYSSLDQMYADYEAQHPLAYTEDVTMMNGGIYIDTNQLFESAEVSFSPVMKVIYVVGAEDTPASYYTPYYYFLNTIVNEISTWSTKNSYIAYTTKFQRGGALKTVGYVKAFFESEEFMLDGPDYFNLYDLYNVTPPREYEYVYPISQFDKDVLQTSQWCQTGLNEASTIKRIQKLNNYARTWIAENRDMIGKVSDETFLKCFALSCAMEHNRLFNTMRADNLEIQELSNEDLLRLSISPKDKVMAGSTMSYARYVYTTGGTIAIYCAAILEVVNFISSWIKPLATLAVFCIACISIFILKMVLRRGNNSVFGYITTIALMCGVNVIGSMFTKLSMYIPNLGFSTAVCIIVQIVIQVAYLALLLKIVKVALKDWKNVGYVHYESAFNKLPTRQRAYMSQDNGLGRGQSGWAYRESLLKIQDKRRRAL